MESVEHNVLFPQNVNVTSRGIGDLYGISILADYPPTTEISSTPLDPAYPPENIKDLDIYSACHLAAPVGQIDINFGPETVNIGYLRITGHSDGKSGHYTFRINGLPYGGMWEEICSSVRYRVANKANSPRVFPQFSVKPGDYQAIQIIVSSTISESYISEVKLL